MSQIAVTTIFTDRILNICVSVAASIHNVILFAYHSHTLLSKSKEKQQKLHTIQWLSLFTATMFTLFPISVAVLVVIDEFKMVTSSCNTRATVGIIIFWCTKVSLYILLMERLFVIFEPSQFRFSSMSIKTTRIFLFVLIVICLIILANEENGTVYSNHCTTNVKLYLKCLFIVTDLGLSTFIMILFARRLWLLSLLRARHNRFYEKLQILMRKTNLLAVIAIVTTGISLIFLSFLPGVVWTVLDSMINMWCILLVFQSYDHIYIFMCRYADRAISNRCLTSCACRCVKVNDNDIVPADKGVTASSGSDGNVKDDQNCKTKSTIQMT
eukprot:153203_1